jgi:hypothetical protein
LLNLKTAGPNSKVSILGATADSFALSKPENSSIRNSFNILSRYFDSDLHHRLNDEILFSSDLEPSKDFILGKLARKLEPAGKVRIFAIVDV